MNIFRHLIEDYKAWRRGEQRIAPRGVTGRIYAPRNQEQPQATDAKEITSEGILTVTAKIIRADGTIEEVNLNGR